MESAYQTISKVLKDANRNAELLYEKVRESENDFPAGIWAVRGMVYPVPVQDPVERSEQLAGILNNRMALVLEQVLERL